MSTVVISGTTGGIHEPRNGLFGGVSSGSCGNGPVLSVHESLRKDIKREAVSMMIYVTLAAVAFLFIYLMVALLRPEWF
jgi:K+-transporting ATPase KdpF subunit